MKRRQRPQASLTLGFKSPQTKDRKWMIIIVTETDLRFSKPFIVHEVPGGASLNKCVLIFKVGNKTLALVLLLSCWRAAVGSKPASCCLFYYFWHIYRQTQCLSIHHFSIPATKCDIFIASRFLPAGARGWGGEGLPFTPGSGQSFHPGPSTRCFCIYFSNQWSQTKQTKEGTTGCLPKGEGGERKGGRGGSDSGWRGRVEKGEWIRNVERMSVAGETKGARMCTVFCFAESAAEHRERRGQRVTKK